MPHLGQTPPNFSAGVSIWTLTQNVSRFGTAIFGLSVFGGTPAATSPQLTAFTNTRPPNLQP